MNGDRTAYIYVRNRFAGTPRETEDGYAFDYEEAYLHSGSPAPVSLTLPLSAEGYHSKVLFPFFDGLIPEGWLPEQVIHTRKLDRRDRFGLLLAACKDPIGCVRVREVKE